jgi:hypothetical protein
MARGRRSICMRRLARRCRGREIVLAGQYDAAEHGRRLDRALVAGAVQGRAIVRAISTTGRSPARRPLRKPSSGSAGLQLAYLDDWPSGENLDVTARFINNGMLATAINGTSMDVQIDRAEAAIPDFHDPQLALSVDAESEGKAMLSFLRATPVGEQREAYLAGLSIGGSGKSHVQMDIPLKHSEDFILDGKVELKDADLVESNRALSFRKANGQVRFTRSGVLAESLATSYEGFPVSLGIAIGGLARDPLNAFEASLTACFRLPHCLRGHPILPRPCRVFRVRRNGRSVLP